MCDPITLGTLAIGAAGTVANTIGKSNAEKRQATEVERWRDYQENARKLEQQRQEGFRGEAQKAAETGLDQVSADNQAKIQAEEAARLAADYTAPQGENVSEASVPTSAADKALLDTPDAGGDVFQTDLARAISDATSSAKKRVAAMANVNAYGGSGGGLGTVVPIAQAESGQGINLQNNFRKGSMSAHEAELAVPPVQVSYSNPIADVAESFLGVGMQGVGKGVAGAGGLGKIFSGAVKPAAAVDPWANMRSPGFTF